MFSQLHLYNSHSCRVCQIIMLSIMGLLRSTVNPGGARWGRSLLISAPNLDSLLRLGRVSSQSSRGLLGGMLACIQQIVIGSSQLISSFRITVILRRTPFNIAFVPVCKRAHAELSKAKCLNVSAITTEITITRLNIITSTFNCIF